MDNDEQLFRSLSDVSPVGLYLTDPDGNCTYVNQSWCRMAGLEPDEAMGQGWIRGIFSGDRDRVREQWSQLVRGNGKWGLEYRFQDREGRITWVYGTVATVHNSHNELVGYIGTNIDITQRKLAEEERRKNSHLQKVILDAIPAVTMLIRHDTKEVVLCNQAAEQIGIIVGQLCSQSDHCNTLCASCPAGKLRDGDHSQHLQIRKGDRYWDYCWSFVTDELYLLYAYDMTEQRRIEQSLRDSEAFLKKAQEIAHIGHWRLDPAADTLIVSDEMLEIFELTKETQSIEAFQKVIHPDDRGYVEDHLQQTIEKGWPFTIKHRLQMADGTIKVVYVIAQAIADLSGKTVYVAGTLQDITEQDKKEKALQESEEKFRRMFMDSAVGMSLINADGRVLKINDAMADFLGYNKDEFKTLRLKDFTHPDDLEESLLNKSRLVAGQTRFFKMEKRFITKTGSMKWGFVTVSTINDERGSPLYRLAQVVDITEQKKNEAALVEYQKKLLAVGSELLLAEENQQKKIAGELHDNVCQLLVSCKMGLGRLKGSLENSAAIGRVTEIAASMDRAIEQIRTLTFDLTNPVLFELGLCQAIEDLGHTCLQQNHHLVTHVRCVNIPCENIAAHLTDNLKIVIYRAVQELFVNIVKHAHANTVDVNLSFNDGILRIEVIDDGTGFDYVTEMQNRKSGHKIGLFITAERLSYFGGHLDFESVTGKGTKAVISIRLQ